MWEWTRKIDVPVSNDTREQTVAGTWLVRWMSIRDSSIGASYPDVSLDQPQVEVFATEAEAQAFVESLLKAYALTRCAGGRWVEMKRQK